MQKKVTLNMQLPFASAKRTKKYISILMPCQSCGMCMHQQDHCAHHWIQISSTLPQQGQSHMDSKHLPTRDPSIRTGSLAALELWKKRTHSKDI